MKSRLLGTVCAVVLPFTAQASILDLGGITRDTTTRLDWLDVTNTLGISYQQAESSFAGWRHASLTELRQLGTHFGLGQTPFVTSGSMSNQDPTKFRNFLQPLLGFTVDPAPSTTARTFGQVQVEQGLNFATRWGGSSALTGINTVGGQWSGGQTIALDATVDPLLGHWMVRVAGSTPDNPLVDTGPGTPDDPTVPIETTPPFIIDIVCNSLLDCSNRTGSSTPVYIDPEYAVGYTYGLDTAGAPNYESVLVPNALPGGDSIFEVSFNGIIQQLTAGQSFLFTDFVAGGVSTFTINGIDVGEMVDPNDPFGFVTGLTFVDNGTQTFSVSMTPVTQSVVPIPAAAWLFGSGLVGLVGISKRKKSA